MKPIANPPPPTLGPGTGPDAVANLQDALLLLIDKQRIRLPDDRRADFEAGLRRDRDAGAYGTGTGSVIVALRQQFQLSPGEVVDQPTADVLNRLLRDLGVLAAPQPEWVVRGQIVDAGGPVNGIAVSVYDRDLFFRRDSPVTGQLLGTDATKSRDDGKTGWFELAYKTADFSAGDIPTNGTPIPELIFALGRDGRAMDAFQIVRVPDGKEITEEMPVSDDDLIMGLEARRVEEVRIVIAGGVAKPPPSEYEQLILALVPLLPDAAPANADFARQEALVGTMLLRFDEENHRDISFAARETGLERGRIATLVPAFRLARNPFENSVAVSAFYGLARAGIAADVIALARASADDLRLALKRASDSTSPTIAPFSPASRLEETVQAIRDRLVGILPNYRATEGAPSLADLLSADLPDAGEQATLWRTFSDHFGTADEFWRKLATLPGFGDPQKVAKVKYSLQLGTLTQNNIALIGAIRTKHPDVGNIGELAFELDTQDKWKALLDIGEITIPDDIPGKLEERTANYAASLASTVQIAHPTAALANLVATLPATAFADTQPIVAQFLSDAVRKAKFDLVEGRINDLLAAHGDDLLKDVQAEQRPLVITQVKRLQRLFRLSAGPQSVKALVEAGFNSARDIAELPPGVALDILTPLIGEAEARVVINRATNISAAALHQYVLLNNAMNSDVPGGAL
ncbi:hypothetical protein NKH74_30405 [Mesorhizobium sp. M0933]|uniref:hypothetical protein n=1 Tax=Mesorhizobium sp. M0933 TaxID=2957030 RepID=UPI00333CA626